LSTVRVAAIQCAFTASREENVARVEALVREAAAKGAQVILPSELFEGVYFCREEKDAYFDWAKPAEGHPTLTRFQKVAKELGVVIPVSFFERDGQAFYNSLAMVDADGSMLGIYRKSHIPDGPGYGAGICWDQWYPECARIMMLLGAEILLYPTAIGTEPGNPELDTKDLWQRAMIGHAVSNGVPVVASNRTGTEGGQTFYGHSFISNHRGDKVAELGRTESGIITSEFDLDEIRRQRASFGFFRDRRPDLYGLLAKP